MPDIHIRPFQPEDAIAFRDLNEDWIKKYFRLEDEDRLVLGDPNRHILAPGGHIFMALSNDQPIGCCALIPMKPGVFELGKMAVAEEYRGRGVGRKILEYAIAQAKALGAESLFLGTNTRLADAIHLYESVGFRHLSPESVPPSPYARANVFMELPL
ncbi:MAG: GNAT family N-acetyltransferase [Acidobacteriota bacterium]|nr:GNAT family N-acetyltransferase [Acidobacteriota bacterium]